MFLGRKYKPNDKVRFSKPLNGFSKSRKCWPKMSLGVCEKEDQDDDEFSSLHWRRSSGRLTDPQSAMISLHSSPGLQGSSLSSLPPLSKVSEKRTRRQHGSRDPRKSPSCSLLIVEKLTDLACRHHPSSIECQVAVRRSGADMRPYLWDRFRFSVFIHVSRRKMCRELVRTFLARPYGRMCGGTRVLIVLETHARYLSFILFRASTSQSRCG
jgi:hypothetical protein